MKQVNEHTKLFVSCVCFTVLATAFTGILYFPQGVEGKGIQRNNQIQSVGTWEYPVPLVETTDTIFFDQGSMKADNNIIHVVWTDQTTNQIKYMRKVGENPWTDNANISPVGVSTLLPRLLVFGNDVFVTYGGYLGSMPVPFLIYSTDAGSSWSNPMQVSSRTAWYPDIAYSNGLLYLITDTDAYQLDMYTSNDFGAHWIRYPSSLASNGGYMPRIAAENGIVHIVWRAIGGMPDEGALWYRRGTTNGTEWGSPTQLNNEQGCYGQLPELAVSGANVHVIWNDFQHQQYQGMGDIYYRRSDDTGLSWTTVTALTVEHRAVVSYEQGLTVSSSNPELISVAWADNRNFPPGNCYTQRDIYYIESLNGGASWGDATNLTHGSLESQNLGSPNVYSLSNEIGVIFWENYHTLWLTKKSVEPTPLSCDAGGQYTGIVGQPVQFYGSASGGTPPYNFTWSFGDSGAGNYSYEKNPNHIYAAVGIYSVNLTVQDNATPNNNYAYDQTTVTIGPADQPDLKITKISGGFGITAVIKNDGTASATNINWTIKITGGILGHINKTISGVKDTLGSGDEMTTKSGVFIGFGKLVITVSASYDEGSIVSNHATGKLVLFWVNIIPCNGSAI